MKKVFIVLLLVQSFLNFDIQAQGQAQPQASTEKKQETSWLVDLPKKYTLDKEATMFLDSINMALKSFSRKRTLVKGELFVSQDVFPVDAQIVRDTFGGRLEVFTLRIVTKIISNKDEADSFKPYFDKEKKARVELADRLRKQAIEVENGN